MLYILRGRVSFLVQNCHKLRSLTITSCFSVTGIGFLRCPKTLTHVVADSMYNNKLTTKGIKAIASGGGLQSLYLSGNAVNNEAVITISKTCPLLKVLQLKS
ncbi:hypothetical protein MKX01_020745 [Papaver californicum]|nr:hypothetical protein MKX01_020745 [Papaver californicum]